MRCVNTYFQLHQGLALLLATAMTLVCDAAFAEDFKVETAIYVGDKEEATSSNITRFKGSIVWDFAGDGSEIAMFDKHRGRFVLMDLKRKVQTEVTTDEVLKFTQQLRQWAGGQDDPLLKFCAAPRLTQSAGPAADSLSFRGTMLNYEIGTQRPPQPEIATRYREFSDWYARVNTVFRPGLLPPFPRLVVNEHLGREGLLPQRVKLTLTSQSGHGSRTMSVRSQQAFTFGLLQSDIDAITRAESYLATLPAVSLAEYRREESPPRK